MSESAGSGLESQSPTRAGLWHGVAGCEDEDRQRAVAVVRHAQVLYGEDGKAIARNPGQVRFELVVDHGGTPDDPSDDVELDFRLCGARTELM